MAGLLLTGSHQVRRLELETREKDEIANEQYYQLSDACEGSMLSQARGVKKDYQGKVHRFRLDASPAYNCHGLTFASRRTCIHKGETVRQIIARDGYEVVKRIAEVLPGDIILYVSSEDGDIEHSGIVIGVLPQPSWPLIVSKWGLGPEVIHSANICPYDQSRMEYYRVVR